MERVSMDRTSKSWNLFRVPRSKGRRGG
jgi:hypothetical protein